MSDKSMRAHSLLQIKRADSEARRISGIASTPATDRQGDQLDPMGATFKLPFPLLLGHDHNAPIGQVIEARATPAGLYIVAQLAPEGTTDKADEGWRAIRAGLIRGLSVGFIGRESEPLPRGGRRFTRWEIIELSAVAVPANAEAAILEVKRLDAQWQRAESEHGGLPRFPRSLSKADRNLLAAAAVDRWVAEVVAKAGGKTGTAGEMMFTRMAADLMIRLRWADERIEALEDQANGS